MSCSYLDNSKETVMSGIYCNRYGGRPGLEYWRCYCDGRSSDCPFLGGRDPYELHSDTRERNRVINAIRDLPYNISIHDRSRIEDARRAYERLDSQQQRFVDNYSKLTDAERAYRNAVEAEEERQRTARREEEQRREQERRQERELREQERKDREARDRENREQKQNEWDTYDSRMGCYDESDDMTSTHIGGSYTRTSLLDSFLSAIEYRVNPKLNNVPWTVRGYRLALPVITFLCMHSALRTPESILKVFLTFSCVQLFSLLLAYICPGAMKVRAAVWLVSAVILAIAGFMLYLDYEPVYMREMLFIVLFYPGAFIVCKLAYALAKIAADLIT